MKIRTTSSGRFAMIAGIAVAVAALLGGCGASNWGRNEGLDNQTIPNELRAEYEVFSLRCSKCHSLSRALNSGIDDDEFWRRYVDRMRHQPGSGINHEDEVVILRFLHYYAETVRKAKASHAASVEAPVKGAL